MTTLIFTHPVCLEHDTGPSHPESAERLRAVLETLAGPDFDALEWRIAPRAERSQLIGVHGIKYISDVLSSMPQQGRVEFDLSGTVVSPASAEAALRAAGAVCAAVDAVALREAKNAFCAVRPPGHHAEPSRTLGFCLFNNVAIGAVHARQGRGFRRIAVLDFDVHHGNGTHAMFEADADLFFASTYQPFLFPVTPVANSNALGNIVTVPLNRGWGSEQFQRVVAEKIIPRLVDFAPDFILLSAGFDAHRHDPIGDLRLYDSDFAWVTAEIVKVAERSCNGRLVSVLEGGYNPRALASACAVHVKELMAA